MLKAVESLSPRNRAATLLFYYDQLSVREIAATLGASVTAVKVRLHRSREQLKELLTPVSAELGGQTRGKKEVTKMVKMTIADIAAQERKDPTTGETNRQHIVTLLDREGGRVLPIWIGPSEGTAIAIGLKDYPVPRPLTHAFLANVIDAIGATVEEVRVEALKEDTFYAVVKLRMGKTVREVDARPSDAMALAVLTGSPIYAAEEVIEKAGVQLEEEVGEKQPLQKGLSQIFKEMKGPGAKWSGMTEEEKREARAKMAHSSITQYAKDAYQDLFGGEGEESDAGAE